MKTINPSSESLRTAFSSIPDDIPVVMLNLLRFKDKAVYPGNEHQCSGKDAYGRYLAQAIEFVGAVGGEPIWEGTALAGLIAPDDEVWDKVLLVRYPTISNFKEMLFDPEYQKITVHRTAALEDSRLIAVLEKDL